MMIFSGLSRWWVSIGLSAALFNFTAISAALSGSVDGFYAIFMGFCTSSAEQEMKITPESAVNACACLYDYSVDKTPEAVKKNILSLSAEATAADFDAVYVNSGLSREVLDDITQMYLVCSRQHGIKKEDQ